MPRSAAPSASSRSRRMGCFALAHRRSTLVGVSSPCSVVKSMHVIARSSQAACHSRLTVRRGGGGGARGPTPRRVGGDAPRRAGGAGEGGGGEKGGSRGG